MLDSLILKDLANVSDASPRSEQTPPGLHTPSYTSLAQVPITE